MGQDARATLPHPPPPHLAESAITTSLLQRKLPAFRAFSSANAFRACEADITAWCVTVCLYLETVVQGALMQPHHLHV